MSKRNVAYANPQQPAFITKLKQEIGYVDQTPTVESKSRALPSCNTSDESDGEDQPQVVVLEKGDLTKEEAAAAKEEVGGKLILFSQPAKRADPEKRKPPCGAHPPKKRPVAEELPVVKKKNKVARNLLSFGDDQEED